MDRKATALAGDPIGPGPEAPLYAPGRKVYPQAVSGFYRNIKWAMLAVTLGIYYLLPFLRWDRGPSAPSQAVLIDFPNRRFYFFFIEIWPQEIYYLTGLLVLAAMVLFLMNAVAGRVWCGYLCPQTVWTDLFYAVERWIEGDRRVRLRNDNGQLTLDIVARKTVKHAIWLTIAWWTGGAWVLYFADAPMMVHQLATFTAPPMAWLWIGLLTFTTYSLAGFMRQQVCVYMCPWPRIQAALTDEYALNVTYRYDRGEPRTSMKKSVVLREQGLPAGDCVDCGQCVAVCPTGIDIRDGLQIDCIQCGLCIDACDTVMAKIGRPARLIAYDTDVNIQRRECGESPRYNIMRARTILYAAIIAAVGGIMLYALAMRGDSGISVIHDRNPVSVRLSDGAVRNGYTVRILNKSLSDRTFGINVAGLPDSVIQIIGGDAMSAEAHQVTVAPDRTVELRILVTVRGRTVAPSEPIDFVLTDIFTGVAEKVSDHFRSPSP